MLPDWRGLGEPIWVQAELRKRAKPTILAMPPAMLAYLEFAVTIHILPELICAQSRRSDVTKRICFYVRESIRAG